MDTAEQTEAAFQAALGDLLARSKVAPGERPSIGVAVSGGGDSMALLAMSVRAGLDLHAVTVDHGLRPESRAETELVAQFCGAAAIPHDVLPLTDLTPGANLSARARTARYDALAEWAIVRGVQTILLGHTRDDQAETVLMRLARGSGTDGLAGMAPIRYWRDIRWLRPLLDLDRADLRDWLRASGIGWTDDPTNQDISFDRVRFRRALDDLETLGLTRARLAATARVMARQRAVLEAAGADLVRTAVRTGTLGEVYLEPTVLATALEDTALRVLADVLMTVSGAPYRPRLDPLQGVLAGITGPDFQGMTLSGCVIAPDGAGVVVAREPAAVPPAPLQRGRQTWDRRWAISAPRPTGYWVSPLGEAGLQRATALLRERAVVPAPDWSAAARPVLRAVPAIWRDADAGADALVAVPSAGLVLGPEAADIKVMPPPAVRARHHDPE